MSFRKIVDGFLFESIGKSNEYDAIVIEQGVFRQPPVHSLKEIIDYINEHKLEKCYITAENINFIDSCPSLKSFSIGGFYNQDFDYSPLYRRPVIEYLNCAAVCEPSWNYNPVNNPIDFSKFGNIKAFRVWGNGTKNLFSNETTEEICTDENNTFSDFKDAKAKNLLRLECTCGGLKTLEGLSNFPNLEKLNLYYQYGLKSIDALKEVSGSLKQFILEGCGRVKDFSVLEKMHNLEYLFLCNRNGTIDNLKFLNNMPNLKWFVLYLNCLDGDLTPCKRIPYVYVKNRRHYNVKDEELSKDKSVPKPWV